MTQKQNYTIENIHINLVKVGDTILHNGDIRTLGKNNIKHSEFMGTTIWGDSYHIGYKPVKLVKFIKPL